MKRQRPQSPGSRSTTMVRFVSQRTSDTYLVISRVGPVENGKPPGSAALCTTTCESSPSANTRRFGPAAGRARDASPQRRRSVAAASPVSPLGGCTENDDGITADAPGRGRSAPRVTASAIEPERRPLTVGHAKQRSALRNATDPSRGARSRRQRHVVSPGRQWLAADRLRGGGQ